MNKSKHINDYDVELVQCGEGGGGQAVNEYPFFPLNLSLITTVL